MTPIQSALKINQLIIKITRGAFRRNTNEYCHIDRALRVEISPKVGNLHQIW